MRIPRIYTPQQLSTGEVVTLESEASHHLARVLRLSSGAAVVVFNGDGSEFSATIESSNHMGLSVRIADRHLPVRESPLRIHLGQGISRGERMDYTLQKSVELGVASIAPLWVNRTQVQLEGKRLERRISHWNAVIRSACEQSGRLVVPTLHVPVTLDVWARAVPTDYRKLLLDPEGESPVRDMISQESDVALVIGPEGGLETSEIARLQSIGFVGVRLGPRVLRTETAAVAALSVVQTLWGDLG